MGFELLSRQWKEKRVNTLKESGDDERRHVWNEKNVKETDYNEVDEMKHEVHSKDMIDISRWWAISDFNEEDECKTRRMAIANKTCVSGKNLLVL